jgi:sortase A
VRHLRRAGLLLLLALAAGHGARAAWIEAKARVAQHLVRAAWERTRRGASDARPWPWADTRPVARLVVPGQRVELFVLAGASGRTLAFGPGHVDGTARPGEPGHAVVSAHRDTHFAFLRRLREGDELLIERPDGRSVRYTVSGTRVVDRRDTWILADDPDETRLTLLTCWPFDAVRPGGPLRYAVTAVSG